jgi:hypothetical protein
MVTAIILEDGVEFILHDLIKDLIHLICIDGLSLWWSVGMVSMICI